VATLSGLCGAHKPKTGIWPLEGSTEAFRDGLYVDTNTRMVVKVNYNRDDNSNGARTWLMQPVAMVRKYVVARRGMF